MALLAFALCLHSAEAAGSGVVPDGAAQAVKDARATALPDWKSTVKNPESHLGAVGGGDLSLVESEKSHWQGGKGSLYSPAVERTVECRSASDPECLAVQVLDKGFPERPAVPDSMIAGRDEVVNATFGSGGSAPGTCRDFIVNVPGITTEAVCSAGAPFVDHTCRTGWLEAVSSTATRWACLTGEARKASFACRITAAPSSILESHWRCLYNAQALGESKTSYIVTQAKASAVFPAICRAPQKTTVERKCSKTLEVKPVGACLLGTVVSISAKGDATLESDGCPGGDALTVSHKCAASETTDVMRTLSVSLNEFGTTTLRGSSSTTLKAGTCKAVVSVKNHKCTGAKKTDCSASVTAVISSNGSITGQIQAKIAYEGYARAGTLEDVWTDDCAGLAGSKAALLGGEE